MISKISVLLLLCFLITLSNSTSLKRKLSGAVHRNVRNIDEEEEISRLDEDEHPISTACKHIDACKIDEETKKLKHCADFKGPESSELCFICRHFFFFCSRKNQAGSIFS